MDTPTSRMDDESDSASVCSGSTMTSRPASFENLETRVSNIEQQLHHRTDGTAPKYDYPGRAGSYAATDAAYEVGRPSKVPRTPEEEKRDEFADSPQNLQCVSTALPARPLVNLTQQI
ncbi:hypothetical protein HPB50_022820 [Hyalomma asiaticum]|uniref:Uncharacterized protein n=1 Tax=Hyalomma asiaticum TaxID=266040 RepID=A0ACB7TM20_HYAAI|nr:hypothetical protein HPB50_022820 [Hyalomma asiaticum]